VLKAEFDRPNPGEGLAVFCEALGLTLEHVHADVSVDADEGATAFVYADLPALSLRRPSDNAALGRFLKRERMDGRVLVLNAVYDAAALRAAYAAGRDLGATHLVFTHLDELNHWGKLWDFLVDGDLTPLFLATGPSLTGDLEEDAVGALLRKTLPGA
jgi:flagellar biosynthesis protein FlhF